MKIGIDISQIAYEKTGVSDYLKNLVEELLRVDKKNEYVLFFSSLRRNLPLRLLSGQAILNNVQVKKFKFPPTILDFLWNRLHIIPIEWLIGKTDVFITSDWTEPPSRGKKATILYDLIVYKHPEETHNQTEFNPLKFIISPNIVKSQKRKLEWVKKESDVVFCISQATKKDAMDILGISENKLRVIYPGT